MTTSGLRFAVLGPVRAWRDGTELDLGSPQQRAMLAVLLLRGGHTASVDELIDALWADDPPRHAVNALQTYASRLRALVEPGRKPKEPPQVLVRSGNGYALRVNDDALDLARFERFTGEAGRRRSAGDLAQAREHLINALDLWGGDALAGIAGPYARTQRTRLTEQWLAAREAKLDLDLELGDHAAAVGELTGISGAHPLRERLRALLMLALYRCGRQAEALGVYADTRHTLAEELGIDPSAALQDLHERILKADPALTPDRPTAAGSTQHVRPAQLPADVADFTGRDAVVGELADVLAAPDPPAVAVVAIAGIGGVGKTTLAVHVAQRLREHFPDGQLHMNLRGADEDPVSPGDALTSFLYALGTPESAIPESVEQRAALFRSAVADRRILLLIDNARDAAHVRALLPGTPGCVVIITSRVRLTGLPVTRTIDLDVLESGEALELFTRIVGEERTAAEPEAAVDVVAMCGYLPLAVRIIAARLAVRPRWTILSIAERLADERRRLAELSTGDLAVEASFQLSYAQLDERLARAFRLLSLLDVPEISLPVFGPMLDCTADEAEEIAEDLADLGLLASVGPGSYQYNDLLKLYARSRVGRDGPPDERFGALVRYLDFALASVRNVFRILEPGDEMAEALAPTVSNGRHYDSSDEALAVAVQVLPATFTGVFRATVEPDGPVTVATDVMVGLEPVLQAGFHWPAMERKTRDLVAAAERAGDGRTLARAHYVRSLGLRYLKRLGEAEAHARAATEIFQRVEDPLVHVRALNTLGAVLNDQGRYEEAGSAYSAGLAVCPGYRHAQAYLTVGLAYVLVNQRRFAEAISASKTSLDLFREIGSARGEARALYALGLALHRHGQSGDALARLDESLAVSRTHGLRAREASALFQIADAHLHLGQAVEACALAGQALAMSRDIGDEATEGRALTILGRALIAAGQRERGQGCLGTAHAILERLGLPAAADALSGR